MTLTLQKVTKSYRDGSNKRSLITDLTIHFPERGLVYIVGPSGCGKSTLVNLMAGITKPDSGTISINDHDIAQIPAYRRDFVALVYQNINLISCLTLKQNVILACKIKGVRFDSSYYASLAKRLEVTDLAHRYPQQVSGGQRQRFGVIRALLSQTPILILDEPTGSCDRNSARLITRILEQSGRSQLVVIVTHDRSQIKGEMVIDFNQLKATYDFKPARYGWVAKNPHRLALPLVYWIRQFYHDINKYILIIASQIVIAITIAVMIVSYFGLSDYYRTADLTLPGSQVVTIEKLDGFFAGEELSQLEREYHLSGYNQPVDLNGLSLSSQDRNLDFISIQISRANPRLNILAGRKIQGLGEVLANQAFLKDGIVVGDFLENKKLGIKLEIVGILEDRYNSYPMVYFDYQALGLELDQTGDSPGSLINLVLNENGNLEATKAQLDQDYYCTSGYLDTIASHKTIINLGYLVAGVFIIVALAIGVLLYGLVLEAIFWSRRVSWALLLSMGQQKTFLMSQLVFEISLVALVITVGASLFSTLIISQINAQALIRELFGLDLVLQPGRPAVMILGAIYLGVGLIAALLQVRKLHRLEISEILKEE